MGSRSFDEFFRKAVGDAPFPFQRAFAEAPILPQLVHIPTGLGKTAMVVLGWLWRRYGGDQERIAATPRRLVYCLPMRVLVEQTRDCAIAWLQRFNLLGGTAQFEEKDGKKTLRSYTPDRDNPGQVTVQVLMGGEDEDDWDIHPEREAILVGTQDMLLSRALNRGYAARRSRWPMQFGLLHTDCLWVFDEIQLMGTGLATTAQLEAFRRMLGSKDGHGCQSVWMSATMRRDWLKTVDFASFLEDARELAFDFGEEIKADGLDEKARKTLEDRWKARKPLAKAEAAMGDAAKLAEEVRSAHKPGTRTIVVVNTVKRACALFAALNNAGGHHPKKGRTRNRTRDSEKDGEAPAASETKLVLLHSRFRPDDRKRRVEEALADIKSGEPGTIVVSTQVIEAGVDVSATTLFTELAPWASLVQRFGRCNRRGKGNDDTGVRWIDVPEKEAAPYDVSDLRTARRHLKGLERKGVGLDQLGVYIKGMNDDDQKTFFKFEHTHVVRRKDLIDLFDTTPDLAGNDIDIDRFVREAEESDVRVFWRWWDQPKGYESPPEDEPPRREELCPAPIGSQKNTGFRDFAGKHAGKIFRWSFLDNKWEKVRGADAARIAPGQVFLVHADAGGYSGERGWDPASAVRVSPVLSEEGPVPADANEADPLSRLAVWQTIAEHADDICRALERVLATLPLTPSEVDALRHAARWHDRGKAHDVFQAALPEGVPDAAMVWAKAPKKGWRRYNRRHFRHELASALAVLDPRNNEIPEGLRDLVAYLVAAHHGKVRLSIRSLPNEKHPDGGRRFARGIWEGDVLPETNLGGGAIAPRVVLSLEPMELGLCEQPPFAGRPSWAEQMIGRRDELGPFRLAYLEAILRAADMRASRPPSLTPNNGRQTA